MIQSQCTGFWFRLIEVRSGCIFSHYMKRLAAVSSIKVHIIPQFIFAGAFFVSRIAYGLSESYAWVLRTMVQIDNGEIANVPVVYTMLLMCSVLSLLNMFWMGGIVFLLFCKRDRPVLTGKVGVGKAD